MVLASTTSVQDSGLLDALVPAFERRESGWRVKVIAVGSGEALELGRNGDADVVMAHSPTAEEKFMAQGHGAVRLEVMKNRFMIVGPSTDPAGVSASSSAPEAFIEIAATGSGFLSRGDGSGTHTKELGLWEDAGVIPSGSWYLTSGQGMAETLAVAVEKQAYTLVDSSTFIAMRKPLSVLHDRGRELENRYSAIVAARARHPDGARTFVQWLATDGQSVISRFGVSSYGERLFDPLGDPG